MANRALCSLSLLSFMALESLCSYAGVTGFKVAPGHGGEGWHRLDIYKLCQTLGFIPVCQHLARAG